MSDGAGNKNLRHEIYNSRSISRNWYIGPAFILCALALLIFSMLIIVYRIFFLG